MLEKYLIEHCSPTLASIKTANLINVSFDDIDVLKKSVDDVNSQLNDKGINLLILKICNDKALIYVCRLNSLKKDLQKSGVGDFLLDCGYDNTEPTECLSRLKTRLELSDTFPHEIGIFLGYPLGDVKGFIENSGQNSKCSGCWKVYCNECDAIKTFAKFNKCTKIYKKLWQNGRSINKLTVCA